MMMLTKGPLAPNQLCTSTEMILGVCGVFLREGAVINDGVFLNNSARQCRMSHAVRRQRGRRGDRWSRSPPGWDSKQPHPAPQPWHKEGSKDTPSPPAAATSPAGTKHQGLGKEWGMGGINK